MIDKYFFFLDSRNMSSALGIPFIPVTSVRAVRRSQEIYIYIYKNPEILYIIA